MGLCVSLLRPFARGQHVGGFNLEITSLQCRRRKVPWGLTLPDCACLPARLPGLPPARRALETPTDRKQSSTL